jgi:hypothetical protein
MVTDMRSDLCSIRLSCVAPKLLVVSFSNGAKEDVIRGEKFSELSDRCDLRVK